MIAALILSVAAAAFDPGGLTFDAAVRAVPVEGAYASPAKRLSGYLPGHEDVPLLQIASYDLGGRRIVAVFNFWDRAPAFFDLKLEGLQGDCRVIDETGTAWTKSEAEETWSAAAPALERIFRERRPSLDRAVREDLEYEKTYKDYGINPMPVI